MLLKDVGSTSPSWELRLLFHFVLVLFLSLRLASATTGGDIIQFPSLPKDKPYKLQPNSETSSNGLVDISAGIANILRNQPPYDVINEFISKKSLNKDQVIDYEAPMIGLAAISLIFAVAIPIIGMIVCCCRLGGKCGGSLDDNKDLDVRPTKKRKQYAFALVVCSVFLIAGAIIILVSTSKMTNTLPKARTTFDDVFDDIVTYKNNSFKQMNHIVGPELLTVLVDVIDKIIVLGEAIVNPIIHQGGPIVINLVNNVIKLDTDIPTASREVGFSVPLIRNIKDINKAYGHLEEIQNTVSSLIADGKKLDETLTMSRENISEARRNCIQDCDSIPDEDFLAVDANFTQVPNVTDTKNRVQDVVNTNLTQEADKGNNSFHNLPNRVQNMASNFTSDFKNYTDKVNNISTDFLRPLEDRVDEILRKSVLPYKSDINSLLKPEGDVVKYDQYRNIAYILIGTLVFIMVFLVLLGIILGMIGASTFDTPSTRGDMSDLGGRILIGAAVFSVFCAFFINILVAVVFLAGTNTSIVCRRVEDMELLRHTIDNPKVMKPLTLTLKGKSVKLVFTDFLNECGENKAPWTVLNMDNIFNLSSVLNYRNDIPNLDKVFADINKTVSDTSVMTDSAKKSVNDSLDAGVQNINFTQYTQQTDKSIVKVSLTSFAENITKAANKTTGVAKTKLQETADTLVNVHKSTVQPAQQKSERLKTLVRELEREAQNIVKDVEEIGKNLDKMENFIVNDAVRIAVKGVTEHTGDVLNSVDQLILHVTNQVRYDIGRCRPIHNMYSSVTSDVCSDYFGNLNASWIGFGLCAVFTLLIIVLTVRAAKHFRRFHRSDNFRDSGQDTEVFELATSL